MLKNSPLIALPLCALLILISSVASAQTLDGHGTNQLGQWELSFQTAYLAAQDVNGDGGTSIEFEDTLGWGFGLAYNFNRKFNLGMEFSWRSINYTGTAVDADDPSETVKYSSRLDTSFFGLSGRWYILDGPVVPFVKGSLGWSLMDTNIFAGWGTGCYWYPYWGYVCGPVPTTYGDSAASYSLGLGAKIDLSSSTFVRVGYDYNWIAIDAIDGNHLFRIDLGFMK